jgi:hypothetical protein
MRCNATVTLDKKGDRVSYCQLDAGHDGEHSIDNTKLIRCQASNNGEQCSQPIGHFGSHSTAGVVKRIWQ